MLPQPSELAPRLAPIRAATYTSADLRRQGYQYSTTLPLQRSAPASSAAQLSPDFTPGSSGFGGLAYVMYDFTIVGYGGNGAVSYDRAATGAAEGDVYIGLANWDTNAWSWFRGEADHIVDLPSIDPFLAFGGKLLVCFVAVGTLPLELQNVRIGSYPPYAFINAGAERGIAPWTVTFDASQSQDEDGTIVEYRWDLESDGEFLTSTGTDPTYTIEIADPQTLTMNVRVFDNDGVYGSRAETVTAWEPRIFSYGSESINEEIRASTFDPDGNLILWGTRTTAANGAVLRMQMSPEGDIAVSTWDGPGHDALYDACDDGFGGAWICGSTDSYGQGGNDGLLQHWNSAGQLDQSWAVGLPVTDEEFTGAVIADNAVLVCGTQFELSTLLYTGLLLRIATGGGTVAWCNEYKSAQACTLSDLAADDFSVNMCGSYTPAAGDTDALWVRALPSTGALAGGGFFGNTTDDERATAVLVGSEALPGVWIGGTIATSGADHSFITRKDGPGAELFADFTVQLNAGSLAQAPRAPITLMLTRRATLTDSTLVLADFDNELNLMPTSEEFASPFTAQTYPLKALPLGANGLLVLGSHIGQLLQPIAPGLNAVPTTRAWRNILVEIGHPVLSSTSTDTTQIAPGDSFYSNRGGTDGDALIMLRDYNALPPT